MARLRQHAGRRRNALVSRLLFVGEHRRPTRARKRFAGQLAIVAASGLAAGVALEFFLDPRSGGRRRHHLRDRVKATVRRRARGVERQTRYEVGKVAGITHPQHEAAELDDISLVHKVESELFRDRSIPARPPRRAVRTASRARRAQPDSRRLDRRTLLPMTSGSGMVG
jgi:hypothetical protein